MKSRSTSGDLPGRVRKGSRNGGGLNHHDDRDNDGEAEDARQLAPNLWIHRKCGKDDREASDHCDAFGGELEMIDRDGRGGERDQRAGNCAG